MSLSNIPSSSLSFTDPHSWRSLFVTHPGHVHKSSEALLHGKAKVICERCLQDQVDKIILAGVQMHVVLSELTARSSLERCIPDRNVVYNQVIQSAEIEWMACRKTNCLFHLQHCDRQPTQIRDAARAALVVVNTARREHRRAKKNSMNTPSTVPESTIVPSYASSTSTNNVISAVDPPAYLRSDANKLSFPSAAPPAVPENSEAVNTPYLVYDSEITALSIDTGFLEDCSARSLPPITPSDVQQGFFRETVGVADNFFYDSPVYEISPVPNSQDDTTSFPMLFASGSQMYNKSPVDITTRMSRRPVTPGWAPHIRRHSFASTTPPTPYQNYFDWSGESGLSNLFDNMRVEENIHNRDVEPAQDLQQPYPQQDIHDRGEEPAPPQQPYLQQEAELPLSYTAPFFAEHGEENYELWW